jgi:glycosyltransferase involved in cell wall biosynthesis
MRFSVVIPTMGRSSVLGETLERLLACDPLPYEVVIVDGDSARSACRVVDAFAERSSRLPVRYRQSAPGVPVQRQACLKAASGDVVVFIDDDAKVDPALFAVLGRAYRDPQVVGATGRIVQPPSRSFGNMQSPIRRLLGFRGKDGTMTRYGYPRFIQRLDAAQDVEFMQGCLMSARRDVALEVGFDLALGGPRGVALLEDEDFSYRLSRIGRVRYLPDAVVHHMALGFHARDAREYSRLIVHDRAYLLSKNFKPNAVTLLQFALLVAMMFAHRIVNREWAGVIGLGEGLRAAWREGYLRPRAATHPLVPPVESTPQQT